jgi:hypothetical protein
MLGSLMRYVSERLWPHAAGDVPDVHRVSDISEGDKREVLKTEDLLRKELIRAETEYLRLRGTPKEGSSQ